MLLQAVKSLKNHALSVDNSEVDLCARGFHHSSNAKRIHLETVGRSFLKGYHLFLTDHGIETSFKQLANEPSNYRGFCIEGAAMAVWLLDSLSVFNRSRWGRFYAQVYTTQPYIIHVGVGWALARLPWSRRNPESRLHRFDKLLKWLVIDGFGFHEGYFHTDKWIRKQERHPNLSQFGKRVFDQGLGRCIWFVGGADVSEIVAIVDRFSEDRKPDLWSGIGLACSYAGACNESELSQLMKASSFHIAHFRQGIAFGVEARFRGGISTEATRKTAEVTCEHSVEDLAELTVLTRQYVEEKSSGEPYEQWRSLIRNSLDLPKVAIA